MSRTSSLFPDPSPVQGSRAVIRHLGDAAVVFDPLSWETHLLPPDLAFVAAIAERISVEGAVTRERLGAALEHELGDIDDVDLGPLCLALERIGVIQA
ncbi:MAG TPA: HPr-rel-A system PqqD family peptide chaperone [Rhodocyclaceae bacterium]|nr:HPr-rel-A system PqqD family peptide chaperone [Rhodocyclaceae bacterium]